MDASTLITWVGAVLSGIVTLILVPLGIYGARYYWDQRRWSRYENRIRTWAHEEFSPDEVTEDEWSALAATKMSEAGFEPEKVSSLLPLAIWYAKGIASEELKGRISLGRKDDKHGERESPR